MRYVALEPYIAELLRFFGEERNIVGVCAGVTLGDEGSAHTVTIEGEPAMGTEILNDSRLCRRTLDISALRAAAPDVIIADLHHPHLGEEFTSGEVKAIEQELAAKLGFSVRLFSYSPRRLEEIFEDSDRLARDLKVTDRGSSIGRRAKAQLMDWGDSFYDRMKNKRVTFVSSIDPLRLGGLWLPDMIQTLSAVSQVKSPAYAHPAAQWGEVVQFRPDVIIVALQDHTLQECMKSFKVMEQYPDWDQIPAVKRGEVVFCDGTAHFFSPGPSIIESFGVMVSAIAGFESGYITRRDSFFRLRWLELQRHRI